MDRRDLLTGTAGLIVTGLAGCLGQQTATNGNVNETPSNGSDTDGSTDSESPAGLDVGQKPPNFSLETTAGGTVSLNPIEKPTVLFFMAAWCTSCKQEEDNLTKIHETYKDDVRLISIDMDPDRDSMADLREFKDNYGDEWTHAMGTAEFIQKYRLTSLDTTYIIDTDGVTQYKDSSVTDVSTFAAELDAILSS